VERIFTKAAWSRKGKDGEGEGEINRKLESLFWARGRALNIVVKVNREDCAREKTSRNKDGVAGKRRKGGHGDEKKEEGHENSSNGGGKEEDAWKSCIRSTNT